MNNKNARYRELLGQISASDIFSPDLPNETAETTLKALWCTAAGKNCSAQHAMDRELPDLTSEEESHLSTLLSKRLCGTPLTHLTGRVNFMGIELLYEPGVLAPRPETELLGFAASEIIDRITVQSESVLGIDVGCGCGNVSCGLASRHPKLQLYSIDITDNCIAMTKNNISFLHLEKQITVYHGDLFSPLHDMQIEGLVDFVVSNPPYIPSAKLQSDLVHLLKHEPKEAFDGGVYGFSLHQRLIKESLTMLKPGGYLLFEFGLGQEKQIQALFKRVTGYEPILFKNDKNGNPRVTIAIKNGLPV